MAVSPLTKPLRIDDPQAMADIGTAPPWMRAKPKPVTGDFDTMLSSLQGARTGIGGPSTTQDRQTGGGVPAEPWTPNANVQQMFPGMGAAPAAGGQVFKSDSIDGLDLWGHPIAPTQNLGSMNPGSLNRGGLPSGNSPLSATDPVGSGGAPSPDLATPQSMTKPMLAGPDDLNTQLSSAYDAAMQKQPMTMAPGKNGTPMMEASTAAAPESAPKMMAASSAAPQMEAGSSAAAPAVQDPYAASNAAYQAAISGNNTANTKPLWMTQQADDAAAAASGTPATAGPPAAAAPAAPAPAAPAPLGSTASINNPGVSVGGQAPWEGAAPITTTRVGADGLPAVDQDFSEQAQKGADAAYKGATQFFDEDFSRDRAGLENQLVNQGFARGSEAFNTELGRMMRSQNAARENAAFQAQGVGHQQAGDLLSRALASRAALMGERERDADRTHGQSLAIAGLGLGARAQDKGVEQASLNSAGASAGAGASLAASRYSTDANTNIALRQLGLSQDAQGFNQLMQLVASSRGGVNMPNFGAPAPLDVTGANSIASNNANAAANRDGSNRAALYQLGGAALGSIFR